MYKVIITNNSVKTVINSPYGNTTNRVTGSIKTAINSIDNFTFTIYPNNAGFDKLAELTTLVDVINIKTNKSEFAGRVLSITDNMDDSGIISKTVLCESYLGYLCDTVQPYGEYHGLTIRQYLSVLIANHNDMVSADKQITVGQITVTDSNDSLYRYTNYETTLDCIKSKLIDSLGGEVRIRVQNGVKYLDYLDIIGEAKQNTIQLAKNLKSITRQVDPTAVCSILIPLGATLEGGDERLTIASVNSGKTYLTDNTAMGIYGKIVKTVEYDDVTTPSALKTKGQKYLADTNRVLTQYQISAVDLSTVGLAIDAFEVGCTYPLKNKLMGIDTTLRVVERTICIESPEQSELVVGDKWATLTSLQVTQSKAVYSKIASQQRKTNSYVQNVVDNATALITGADGGYVVIDTTSDAQRILVLNTTDINTATSCIQINKNGIGFWNYAKDGGSASLGPYNNAWTIDGSLVADFITTGNLVGLNINNGNGTFTVDPAGVMTATKATISGRITATSGAIGSWTIGNDKLYSGGTYGYTMLKSDGDIAFACGAAANSSADGANLKIWHNGRVTIGSNADNQMRLEAGHIDFYYGGTKNGRLGQAYGTYPTFEDCHVGISTNARYLRGVLSGDNGAVVSLIGAGSDDVIRVGSSANACDAQLACGSANGLALAVGGSKIINVTSSGVDFTASGNSVATLKYTGLDFNGSYGILCDDSYVLRKYSSYICVGADTVPLRLYGSIIVGQPNFINVVANGSVTCNSLTTSYNANVGSTLTTGGNITCGGHINLQNAYSVYCADSGGTDRAVLRVTSSNNLAIGNTALSGNTDLYASSGSAVRIYVNGNNVASVNTYGLILPVGKSVYDDANGRVIGSNSANVYVATTTKGLYLYGSSITANKTITVSSDARLKNTITPLSNKYTALLDHLNAKTFRYNGDNKGKINCGFIAQELLTALSDVGLTTNEFAGFDCDENGMMSIGYEQFIPIMWQILKNLKRKVEQYESN